MPQKRRITAEDLYKFELISDVQISPDGENIIFVKQWVDSKNEKKYSNLWLVPTLKGTAKRFTSGKHVDRLPRWSPDGDKIAFLSNRDDEKQFQIYIISTKGGEAIQLTNLKGEFGSLSWSPDGRYLLCQFRKKDQEALEREKDERKKKLGVVDRQVERVFYKLDGYGFLPKERWHIWKIDAHNGKALQLTDGDLYDEINPAFSPDGKFIVFASNRSPDPDLDPDAVDLFTIPSEGGEFHKLKTPPGPKQYPVFSPDGSWIAYIGKEGRSDWWKNHALWIAPIDNAQPAINLTGKYDIHLGQATINDMNAGGASISPPIWSSDGKSIYFQVSRHGDTHLYSVDVSGENLAKLTQEKGVAGIFSLDQAQKYLAYFWGTMTDPGQINVLDLTTGQQRQRTKLNQRLLKSIDLGEIEEHWIDSRDGTKIHGWIIKPPGFASRQRYPSILEIHGGPLTQYGNYFMHEFYYLAAQGYIVHFSNPRGGRGYGEAHAGAIWGDWGNKDFNDLMDWTDFIASLSYIDPDRMGVTGGSYGGYMTLWIIGHTQRFKAAVAQRVVSNFVSMWGSSDFNWIFQQVVNNQPPWEDIEGLWAHSPMKYIGNAKTPTMLIHSEQDHRCPIEQGEQAFVALKYLGVPTELIRFPDEPHGLSRTGRTDRRIRRLNHILRWFQLYNP